MPETRKPGARPSARPKGRPRVVELLDGEHPESTLYTRLYRQLRERILAGALQAGTRLPSARTMASDLGVSRNTVEAAYGQLQAEGFVERRVGAGTVVATSIGTTVPFTRVKSGGASQAPPPPPVLARPALVALGRHELDADKLGGPCVVDVRHFPLGTWTRLVTRVARQGNLSWLHTGDPQGDPALRRAIAEHVALTRGVRCDPSQVVVVHSTQQAIDLTSRLLLPSGGTAIVEEPGYPGARSVFAAAGARVLASPVDNDGLRTDLLPAEGAGALVYVTPSHQFPLGVTLSLARRLELLAWAAARSAWILEDDYDSEFRHDGRPVAALQGLDRADRVIYLGTWNKVLFPGLRLAYLVLPPNLVSAFVAARRLMDGPPPALLQATLAHFITDGHLSAYLRSARQHYTRRRDVLVDAASTTWSTNVRLGPSNTGLHLVAHVSSHVDDHALVNHLPNELRVGVGALSSYFAAPTTQRGVLLSYGAAPPLAIRRAVAAFAPALHEALRRHQDAPVRSTTAPGTNGRYRAVISSR